MSFQIFLLVGHLTNWIGHNLLTDNTLKKRTQDVLVTCSVIVSDHNVKLAGHFQNFLGQCLMTDCYFQHCLMSTVFPKKRFHSQSAVNGKWPPINWILAGFWYHVISSYFDAFCELHGIRKHI